jgi:hypothetical protein
LRDSYRYSQILGHLYRLDEGETVLSLDSDSVVFRPVSLDRLMDNRELIVVNGPPSDGHPAKPLMNMMVLRNTAASRALLHALVSSSCHVVELKIDRMDLDSMLVSAGLLPCGVVLADWYVNITWRQVNWFTAALFLACLGALPPARADDRPFDQMLHDLNLQKLLVQQVNGALCEGLPVLRPPAYPVLSNQPQTSLDPNARVAFVTLYTHHINSYARVAEHNISRYCQRHGYAYHMYREIPDDLGPEISGNWTKPQVLQ